KNGPLYYDHDKRYWTRTLYRKVSLKYINGLQNITNEVLNYSINTIYGISQDPDTENYIIVFENECCEKCSKEYTNIMHQWCKPCQINGLKENFIHWVSKNEEVDNFILEVQLKI